MKVGDIKHRLPCYIPWMIAGCATISVAVVFIRLPTLFSTPLMGETKDIIWGVEHIVLPDWKRILLVVLACVSVSPYILRQVHSDPVRSVDNWVNLGLVFGIAMLWLACTAVSESRLQLNPLIIEQAAELTGQEASVLLEKQLATALGNPGIRYRLALTSLDSFSFCLAFCVVVHAFREAGRKAGRLSWLSIIAALLSVLFLTTVGGMLWSFLCLLIFSKVFMEGIVRTAVIGAWMRWTNPVTLFGLLSLWLAAAASERDGHAEEDHIEKSESCLRRGLLWLLLLLPLAFLFRRGLAFYKLSTECAVYVDDLRRGLEHLTKLSIASFPYEWSWLNLYLCAAALLYTVYLLYNWGIKDRPWLCLLLTGILVGASYWPVGAIENETQPIPSVLLSLLCPIMFIFFWLVKMKEKGRNTGGG